MSIRSSTAIYDRGISVMFIGGIISLFQPILRMPSLLRSTIKGMGLSGSCSCVKFDLIIFHYDLIIGSGEDPFISSIIGSSSQIVKIKVFRINS